MPVPPYGSAGQLGCVSAEALGRTMGGNSARWSETSARQEDADAPGVELTRHAKGAKREDPTKTLKLIVILCLT